ncbi:MAG: ABC transporter ATP-binding protein [Actinomycetota bacterium]|nr:ABC transporter ATP-binding protein [Actinomycetota bacterium]
MTTISDRLRPAMPPASDALLSIEDLRVHFDTDAGMVKAVDGISWSIKPGETLGIVGESGSGKSVSAMAVMGLLAAPPATFPSGKIMFREQNLLTLDAAAMRQIKGNEISMIFQDPLTSLNPVFKIGHQIAEVIRVHEKVGRVPAQRRAVDLLAEVGIPNPKQRANEYPHQFSGGMRQRAMIAMALALDPVLLLADEPSTALDVTVQAQIMDLLVKLQTERGTAIVLITHDLGLVASHADRVLVMYAGRVAELGTADQVFYQPEHAYTFGLLSSLARLDQRRSRRLTPIQGQPPSLIRVPIGCPFHPRCTFSTEICEQQVPLLVAHGAPDHFAACHHSAEVEAKAAATALLGPDSWAPPVAPVPGEAADEVAVSGPAAAVVVGAPAVEVGAAPAPAPAPAGPSTVPLLEVVDLVKWFPITSGIAFKHHIGDVRAVDGVSFKVFKGETLALVGESGCGKSTTARTVLRLLEPTSGQIVFEGKDITKAKADAMRKLRREMQIVFQDPYASLDPRMTIRNILNEPYVIHRVEGEDVQVLLERVGLAPEHASRYPHEFSGGQRQRVGIARAIALGPRLVVCDEPVSALDVSIQAQVINLLEELQDTLGLTYLFIAHDLSVVRHIADRVAVMYLGAIVETADRDELFDRPAHPYTQALLSAVPIPDPRKERARKRILVTGDVPSPANPPSGCRFRTRCPKLANELTEAERQKCHDERPELIDRGQGHPVACHYAEVKAVV